MSTQAEGRMERLLRRGRAGSESLTSASVVELLSNYLTERRRARIEHVLDGRTYSLATVVEGLHDVGNISAIMRSAEAFGVQPFHVVAGGRFKLSSRTTQGAEKWLDVHKWRDAAECAAYLKDHGYWLVATHLDDSSVRLEDLDFTESTALVFGNEAEGVSSEMLELADEQVAICSPGFAQSFNVSVAAAICLHHAYRDRLTRRGYHGDLTEAERNRLRASFYIRATPHGEALVRHELLGDAG